ncbi:MAG: RdgB/HAM1 family non-canonical purine NTP pyrophosphatase [Methanoregula sp.]|jgi:XTP/dITP diphosphohydrolase|nr:RdgB/HAM1 family non-canonical purine NTP pyrophosphatase [Methanoregula sp.]
MKLTMVTSNTNKAREVAEFFGGFLDVTFVPLEIPELRSDDVEVISRQKAQYAYDHLLTPLIVDDTSFSIDALNGFPGPYAAYVLYSIGNTGILKLMKDVENRNAHFTTVIAFADEKSIRNFSGTIHGRIITVPRGSGGFGYDPIFDVDGRTLAELPLEEKSRLSHRALALTAFREWFVQEYRP